MSATLDPIVISKLRQFSRRRRRLLLLRGISAAVVTLLTGLAIVGFVDWLWLLSDQVRWLLSAGVYVSVVAVVWTTSLRFLFQAPHRRELASRVEELQPDLRERLLSAVELATEDLSAINDSPVFRRLLQADVAKQILPVRIGRLLPLKLIAFWLVAAVITGALAIALLSVPDQRFRQLATRALLPGANIARISRIQVDIVEPSPASLTVAENESVAVIIATSGGRVSSAVLETRTTSQGNVKQKMAAVDENKFAANIYVADEPVEYRILAGDAITEYFLIDAVPRPQVRTFEKRYQYPDYAQLPDETVTETHGDIVVLEGTTAHLSIEVNQQMKEAELRIESSETDEVRSVPLTRSPDSTLKWEAEVPVLEAAIFKVHLLSAESGFTNPFGPKYEIRPQPDLIPRTGFVDQTITTLLLPPNELLALRAMAEDDLPLAELQQEVSINGQEWEATELDFEPSDEGAGRQVTASWNWDLETLDLKTGDQVLTRLVAVDRKGNRGESVPLRIIVAAADYDPDRHAIMQSKLTLWDDLKEMANQFDSLRTSAIEIVDRIAASTDSDAITDADQLALLDLAIKLREQSRTMLDRIHEVQGQMPPGADSQDVDLVGRVVARMHGEHAAMPAFLLSRLKTTTDAEQRKRDLDQLKYAFNRMADDAKNVTNHYQQLAAYNFLRALAFDLDALLRQQQFVVNSPTQTWQRLLRQQSVSLQQLESLDELINSQQARLPQPIASQMAALATWSDSYRGRLQDAMESDDQLPQLQTLSKGLLQELKGRQRMELIDGGLPGRLTVARKDLERRSGTLYTVLNEVGRAVQQQRHWLTQATQAPDSQTSQEHMAQAERFETEIELKHRSRLQWLAELRDLTQNRPDGDSQFAADAGLTRRAVTHLLNQSTTETDDTQEVSKHLLTIAPAYRTLEAGHDFAIALDLVGKLQNMERWNQETLDAHIDHPRQWDLLQQVLETASERLRQARVPEEITRSVDEARWSQSARDMGRRINERRWNRDLMVSAAHEVTEIRNELLEIEQQLQPVMAEARATIAQFAPTIPEMARQAAEELRELEDQSTAAADQIEQTDAPESPESLAPLERRQEQINQQIADLFEALVEDANNQDLLDDAQRLRARDADAAIATVQPPATEMNQSLQRAIDSPNTIEQTQQLAQAVEDQERTAQALELVADHFEALDEGQDVSESREKLQEAVPAGDFEATSNEFEQTEQIADMLGQDVQSLMEELEAELKRNPAMQEALSEISRNTLADAEDALNLAARDERTIQQNNERTDAAFLQNKRELAQELRQLGTEAANLANGLVVRAQQSASQGKTQDAAATLQLARVELQEATRLAHSAKEDVPLRELATTAEQTRDALREATETLRRAEGQTEKGKSKEIHPDDAARQRAKQAADKRHRDHLTQQRRQKQTAVQQRRNAKKQADNQVNQAKRRITQAEKQVAQAKKRADAMPDSAPLKRNVENTQRNLDKVKEQHKQLEQRQQQAAKALDKAQAEFDAIQRQKPPELKATNPDTELADLYSEEAVKVAEELNRKAEELAGSTDFQDTLSTPKNQLAAARDQQQDVGQDVQQIAEDLARAARHERRLDNDAAAEAIDGASQQVQQVADNPVADAESRLQAAAEQESEDGGAEQPPQQVAPAQQALAESQDALAEQADSLAATTEALESAEAESGQPAQDGSADNSESGAPMSPAEGQPQGSPQQGSPQQGDSPQSADPSSNAAAGQPSSDGSQSGFSPEQRERGQQLAQALDELDRLQAAGDSGEPSTPLASGQGQLPLSSLQQAAQQSRAALAESRSARQQQATQALTQSMSPSEGVPPTTGPQGEIELRTVNRREQREWGKLRSQSAEDLTRGDTDSVSSEYRTSVEAYFKVLAERAGNKK